MPRIMSFALTTEQIRNRTKTVTRRMGWKFLKAGYLVWAVEKAQGLKKGEKVKRLALLRIIAVRREHLFDITSDDVLREGFIGKSPAWFIEMFKSTTRCRSHKEVTRIEFEYMEEETPPDDVHCLALKPGLPAGLSPKPKTR